LKILISSYKDVF